jgi:AcrR family transcriptional regulator
MTFCDKKANLPVKMPGMTRSRPTYAERRAAFAVETRARILAAAMELIPSAESGLSINEIAREAGVAVQSIYDHFGSKGGLLVAVIQDVQRQGGLSEGIDEVFRSRDGESALRRMTAATMALWHRGWPFLGFILRSRRSDPVVERQYDALDTLRHAHLWAICRRLEMEGRIDAGNSAEWGADQALALSAATVYEDLVVRRGWSLSAATDSINRALAAAILEPESAAVYSPAPDWAALEAEAAARAIAEGADGALFPAAWRPREAIVTTEDG